MRPELGRLGRLGRSASWRVRRARRGVALVLTVILLALMTVVVVQLAFMTKVEVRSAANLQADLQNEHAIRAALAQARLALAADAAESSRPYDDLHEPWAQSYAPLEIGEAKVNWRIEDEERRLFIGNLVKQDGTADGAVATRLTRLCDETGWSEVKLAERLIDFVDDDRDGSYELGARNAPLRTLEELRLIPEVPLALLYGNPADSTVKGLLSLLTIWSSGRVNVNTAPVEVLVALSEQMTSDGAQAIVNYRETELPTGGYQAFQKPEDLSQVLPQEVAGSIAPLVSTQSQFFTIFARAETAGVARKVRLHLYREGGAVRLFFSEDELPVVEQLQE